MSRMITRSMSRLSMENPTQANKPKKQPKPKPVAKSLKTPTSTKLKTKSVNQKIAVTSQVKQANDASMPLLKPRISIGSLDLESLKSFPVADLNIMKPAQADARTDCQATSRPVLKVLPMRRQTTESCFKTKSISSRRETISTTTQSTTTPVRRSERIRLNQSTPIYFETREFRYQKRAVHSLPDIPKVKENLPSTSTTKISKRRKTTFVSKEHKEPSDSQPKTAADRESAPIYFQTRESRYQKRAVHSLPDIPKVKENLPSTSTPKISKRRKTTFVLKEYKEPSDNQPKTAANRESAVATAVHPSSAETPKVNETLPSMSATKISNERKEPTDAQPKTAAKRKLEVPTSVHPSLVEIAEVNEIPSTLATNISNEGKEPTDAHPKTAAKRKLEAPTSVHLSLVEIPEVNESLQSTSTTKISKRRKTTFVSKEYKEPTDPQPKTAAKRKLDAPTAVHPFPVEIPEVNENLPSTSATKILNEHKEPTDPQLKTAAKRKMEALPAVQRSLVEISEANENLPSPSATKILNDRKEPTEPQPKTAAERKLEAPTSVHPAPVETPKVNENLPSTSATKISMRRKTIFVSKEYKEPTHSQPKTAAKRKLEAPTAVHPSPVEIREVNENLPSTSATKILNEHKEPTDPQLKTAAKRKMEALPAVQRSPVEISEANENLPSASATKILNDRKEPTEPQPKTAAERKLEAPTSVHPAPVETPKVNENLPSTSATKISKRRTTTFVSKEYKKPTYAQPKITAELKLAVPIAIHPIPVQNPKVNKSLPSTSTTKISTRRTTIFFSKEPTDAQQKTAAKRKLEATTLYSTPIPKKRTDQLSVDISPVAIRKEYENLPSTSKTAISRQRTTILSKERKEQTTFSPPIHSTPVEISSKEMSSNHPNPNEILKLNENLPSTSRAKISRRLSTNYARKSAGPSVLAEIANGNSPSTSNVMANEGIEIIIPSALKKLLVDDVNIVKTGKQYKMPATQSVAKIIELYVELKPTARKDENHFGFTDKQIFDNILEYFDTLLGEQLLYESERIRYLDMMNNFPGEKMSTLYPPIYLLRLFVKLNSLLKFSCTDKETLRYIINYVNEFAKYLAENKSIFSDMNIFC